MKKNLNKLATLALTGMMVAGMSFGSLAATSEAYAQTKLFEKKVLTDGKTFAPNTTFEFELTALSDISSLSNFKGTLNGEEKTLDSGYLKATTGYMLTKVHLSSVTFAAADTEVPQAEYTKEAELSIDAEAFTEPGIYVFGVKEKQETGKKYEGIKYDDTQYYLLVSVTNNETGTAYVVSSVGLAKADGTSQIKTDGMENHYGDSENHNDVNDLVLKKILSGLAVNHSDKFKFNVTVAPQNNEGVTINNNVAVPEKYAYYKVNANGVESTDLGGTLTAGEVAEIELAENESIHIYGLSKSDEVTIVEQAASGTGKGYTVSYTASGLKEGNQDTDTKLSANGVSVYANEDNAKVTVKNSKDEITVTGVAMNIAPYAAMVLGAGAFAGIFLGGKRRKAEDED